MQALLAARPSVLSLAETHYFEHLFGHFDDWLYENPRAQRKWASRLSLARGWTHGKLTRSLSDALDPSLPAARLHRRLTGRGYVREFADALDILARQLGCSVWIEKSPDHLAYIDILAELIPDAQFIHVIRNGEDVVSSAIEGQLQYHDQGVFRGGLDYWVQRWNRAARVHLRYAGNPRHLVVPHEALIARPDDAGRALADFAGLDSESVVVATARSTSRIADALCEPWKRSALDGVVRPLTRKFESLFGPRLRQLISSRLDDYTEIRHRLAKAQAGQAWLAPGSTAFNPASAMRYRR